MIVISATPLSTQLLPTRFRRDDDALPLDPALTAALSEIFQISFSQVRGRPRRTALCPCCPSAHAASTLFGLSSLCRRRPTFCCIRLHCALWQSARHGFTPHPITCMRQCRPRLKRCRWSAHPRSAPYTFFSAVIIASCCLPDVVICFRTYPPPPSVLSCPHLQDGAITLRNICAACHDQIAADERLDAYVCRAAELLPSLWYVGACSMTTPALSTQFVNSAHCSPMPVSYTPPPFSCLLMIHSDAAPMMLPKA